MKVQKKQEKKSNGETHFVMKNTDLIKVVGKAWKSEYIPAIHLLSVSLWDMQIWDLSCNENFVWFFPKELIQNMVY